jgi:hypothetical protein
VTSDVQETNGRATATVLTRAKGVDPADLRDEDDPGPPPRFLRERAPRGEAEVDADGKPLSRWVLAVFGGLRGCVPGWRPILRLILTGMGRAALRRGQQA